MLLAGLVRRRCAIATTAVLLLVTACSKTVSAFDRRATYPDSCPMGIDTAGQQSRLCVPNASGLKGWTPTYNMSMSTIIMPCNTTGYFRPSAVARYGIVDVDWSNAKQVRRPRVQTTTDVIGSTAASSISSHTCLHFAVADVCHPL